MISIRDNNNNNVKQNAPLKDLSDDGTGSKEILMDINNGTSTAYVVTEASNPHTNTCSSTDVVALSPKIEDTSRDEVTASKLQSIGASKPLTPNIGNIVIDVTPSLNSITNIPPDTVVPVHTDKDGLICAESPIVEDSATAVSQTSNLVMESSSDKLNKEPKEFTDKKNSQKELLSHTTTEITGTNADTLAEAQEGHKYTNANYYSENEKQYAENYQALESTSWRPSVSFQTDSVRVNGRFIKTYDEWLEEKKSIKGKKKPEVTPTLNRDEETTEEVKDSERQLLHEKWIAAKEREFKKQKLRTKSEESSLQTLRRMRTFSSHACTFEQWLEKKREEVPQRSITPTPFVDTKNNPIKRQAKRERIKHGMTFKEWKDWKERERERKLREVALEYENNYQELEKERRKELNDRTYEQWLQRKNEERKINIALQETLRAQQIQVERIRKQQKLCDPHLKTFDEWLLEKDYDRKCEAVRQNDDSYEHHPEDSEIIFDMWLANKFAYEMSAERTKLNKVKYGEGFGSTMSINEGGSGKDSNSDYDNDFESDSD